VVGWGDRYGYGHSPGEDLKEPVVSTGDGREMIQRLALLSFLECVSSASLGTSTRRSSPRRHYYYNFEDIYTPRFHMTESKLFTTDPSHYPLNSYFLSMAIPIIFTAFFEAKFSPGGSKDLDSP
jgi:hypothetical protein